jgi:hypothetical protein
VHYALLPKKIAEGKFERVGVAMLYPGAWELRDKEVVGFEIV